LPSGRYAVAGSSGEVVGAEDFRCAPGPMGWRYFSEIERSEPEPHAELVDVAVDDRWRIVRTRIETGTHSLLVEPGHGVLAGTRDGEPFEMAYEDESHLDYLSPAFNAITVRRLEDTKGEASARDIDVVYLEPVTLEPIRTRQRYELLGDDAVDTPVGRFDATRWRYTALTTGWTSELWVADDVVVRYDKAFELIAYDPGGSGPVPIRP
jgi:hypothetical protein